MMPSLNTPALAEAPRRAAPIVAWLMDEERIKPGRTTNLLDRFARRVGEAGVPLDRMSVHIQQLHPQLAARSLIWDREAGGAMEAGHEHSTRYEPGYLRSPIKVIFEGGDPIRRRLEDADCPLDFGILPDLKGQGYTDYSIQPLLFSGNVANVISLATKRTGGFDDAGIAMLDAVLPAFGAVLELQQQRRTARDLLDTYVGPRTGERIFDGVIQRGDGEVIHAVLWYCDLRGFTRLTETLPLDDVIALLNDYFDTMAGPVAARGGEVLKFVGDAMLAIFQCEAKEDALCGAADMALVAAQEAHDGIARLNRTREVAGKPCIGAGIALHIGEVMYGNIGAAERLDFTVIGPAVNLVTRLEPLCAAMGCPIVMSGNLARAARREVRSLGRHELKGIAEPVEAFTLA
jgi:adenylate cyclase